MDKYVLDPVPGSTLSRVVAIRDFGDVKTGDIGGFIESERNLSHAGDCWVYDQAVVRDLASVIGNGKAQGHAYLVDRSIINGAGVAADATLLHGMALVAGTGVVRGHTVFSDTITEGVRNNAG